MKEKKISPLPRWQALLGVLPFLAFGISNIIEITDHIYPFGGFQTDRVVYTFALLGLLIGWIRSFPLWSYSYLGWAFLLAYFNTNWGTYSEPDFQVWIPFGVTVVIALLWTRSLAPIEKLFNDIWHDWTRLFLTMFTIAGLMGGGEDNHPLWLLFSIAATLIVSIGAWCFLRSSTRIGRVLSIAISFILSTVPTAISYLTWDWRSHYGFPPAENWTGNLGVAPIGVLFWLLILFWPALIGLLHYMISRYRVLEKRKGTSDG